MHNYDQIEIIPPNGKFETRQSNDGHSLLFAVDSSSIFLLKLLERKSELHTLAGRSALVVNEEEVDSRMIAFLLMDVANDVICLLLGQEHWMRKG